MNRCKSQTEGVKRMIEHSKRMTTDRLSRRRYRNYVLAVAFTACGVMGLVPQTVRSDRTNESARSMI